VDLLPARFPKIESGHDSRESCLSRLDPAIPAHCHAVRHGFAKGGLQTFNEPGRNLIEPQTRLGGITLASAAPFEGCDVDSNPFPSDHDIGVGGITTLFPRCREPSGDGFDGGSLLLLQIPHASLACKRAIMLQIDLASRVLVYEQIANGLRAELVSGKFSPGEKLPTVRTLAINLGVHHNTVAEAYRQLANEGWLEPWW
jgi:hypothetical protein